MARRPRKRSVFDSEFAKLLFGLVLIGLLWAAFRVGFLAWVGERLVGLLKT